MLTGGISLRLDGRALKIPTALELGEAGECNRGTLTLTISRPLSLTARHVSEPG